MSHKLLTTLTLLVLNMCHLSVASPPKHNVTLKTTWCQASCDAQQYETSKCRSSIVVDGTEMSQQKDGFNIVNMKTMKTVKGVALRWFNASRQGANYVNFVDFCEKAPTGSVLLISLQNMCGSFYNKWYELLRKKCNVTLPRIRLQRLHNMALAVACKGKCDDHEPKAEAKYVTTSDSITASYIISAVVDDVSTSKSYSKAILVAVVAVLVAVILIVLCILWNNRRRRGQSSTNHAKPSDKKHIFYKPSAEEKYRDPSTLPPPPSNDEEDGAYVTMRGGNPSDSSVKYEVPNARKVPNSPKNNNQGYDYAYSNSKNRNNTMSNNKKQSLEDEDAYENMNGDAYVDMTDARTPLTPKGKSSNAERLLSEFDDEPYVNMNTVEEEGEDQPYVDMLPYNKKQPSKKKKNPKSSQYDDADDDAYEDMDGDDEVYESMDLYKGDVVF